MHPYLCSDFPIALAHRGGAGEAPENTIEAFASSYHLGYRYMETDVHLSKDGVVVAFHDPRLDRVSDVIGNINDKSWQQISAIKVSETGRIPSLDYLLREYPDVKFNIDMKSDLVIQPLLSLLIQHDALHRVCLASFHDSRLKLARKIAGEDLCTSTGRIAIASHLARASGLPMSAVSEPLMQIPLKRYGVRVLSQRFIDRAHADGKFVHVWTIDEASQMHRLLDMGVDGIITDVPQILKAVLIERGTWSSPN